MAEIVQRTIYDSEVHTVKSESDTAEHIKTSFMWQQLKLSILANTD